MNKLEENKKDIILNNCRNTIYKDKIEALKKAKELRDKYNISVYPNRITKEAIITGRKNICKTYYKEVFVLC